MTVIRSKEQTQVPEWSGPFSVSITVEGEKKYIINTSTCQQF